MVSLSCTVCGSVLATSTAPSANCNRDIQVTLNYGGFTSDPFMVRIVAPNIVTLDVGYPVNQGDGLAGYLTTYNWTLSDACGYLDTNLDANEQFGAWTDDYFNTFGIHNNWGAPTPKSAQNVGATLVDVIGARNMTTPPSVPPGQLLSTVAVTHDSPWNLFVGSLSFGSGLAVITDTQQWYLDHGVNH